jgi:UDPglucose--hexose-1-phosphate uridylyltransferase
MVERSEIRHDYFLSQEVIISPGRVARLKNKKDKPSINKKQTVDCFFCPAKMDYSNVVDRLPAKSGKKWQVAVINNIYPAVEMNNKQAFGKQEVIVDTSKHNQSLADISVQELALVLEMYARRTEELSKQPPLNYILCFKNCGFEAGASLEHSHSQVFATKILPAAIRSELLAMRRYRRRTGHCPHCDIIAKEIAQKRRLIWQDQNAVAIAPYASRFRYEVWLMPKRHQDNIVQTSHVELLSLAGGLSLVLKKLQLLGLAYNICLHQVISAVDQHFVIKIQPRADIWAGVEIGSGLIINPVPPEDAAEFYRSN